ncbi:LytR/AlgR family response regulator transcription factor [Winogradskyella flava]|uniref:Response regulator transcription factor n=1 Tax=Winogradskyella flava TaxID=1884876 RepID=A0A842IV17_9FLAO|nr:LytTR family DNA-binding domain-containing protein [Winogradskyella flava]MBC2846645.1 response regulator transcription factor [Winogradskyella flava]
MVRYLIIDDEYIAHDIIKGYCSMLPNMQLAKQCYDALEALDYLQQHQVDLIFLDLNMPKLKGFAFLKTLSIPPKIIVTTAYQEYALEGYELNITDYLLKPFSFERFLKAVHKVLEVNPNEISSIAKESKKAQDHIFIYTDKKYIRIQTQDILYIEAAGNYLKVITIKEQFLTREKISNLTRRLVHDSFIQVHKSYIVSKSHIEVIEGNRIKIMDTFIPIGKLYKSNVNDLLG